MTRLFLLFLIALVCAPVALAQDEVLRYEFYGGYAYQRANNNADTFSRNGQATFNGTPVGLQARDQHYHGFTGEFNQNITKHIGIVTSFTGVYDNTPYVSTAGRAFTANARRYDLMFGPRYNFRLQGFTPFVEGLAGFEHMRVRIDGLQGAERADTAFAMQLGGGLDVHLTEHFDIRAIQADYIPTFYNSTHQNNFRVGAGVKVKFGQDP